MPNMYTMVTWRRYGGTASTWAAYHLTDQPTGRAHIHGVLLLCGLPAPSERTAQLVLGLDAEDYARKACQRCQEIAKAAPR